MKKQPKADRLKPEHWSTVAGVAEQLPPLLIALAGIDLRKYNGPSNAPTKSVLTTAERALSEAGDALADLVRESIEASEAARSPDPNRKG